MAISNVAITDTFQALITITNQLVTAMNPLATGTVLGANVVLQLANLSANIASVYALANTHSLQLANVAANVTSVYTLANTHTLQIANASANLIAAFGVANTGATTAVAAFSQANTGVTTAVAAFGQANTGVTTGVAAFTQANTAQVTAVAAFAKANTVSGLVDGGIKTADFTTFANSSFWVHATNTSIGIINVTMHTANAGGDVVEIKKVGLNPVYIVWNGANGKGETANSFFGPEGDVLFKFTANTNRGWIW